jgi:hypothetical protein
MGTAPWGDAAMVKSAPLPMRERHPHGIMILLYVLGCIGTVGKRLSRA